MSDHEGNGKHPTENLHVQSVFERLFGESHIDERREI